MQVIRIQNFPYPPKLVREIGTINAKFQTFRMENGKDTEYRPDVHIVHLKKIDMVFKVMNKYTYDTRFRKYTRGLDR